MSQSHTETRLDSTSSLLYLEEYIDPINAATLFEKTMQDISWEQSKIAMFGKRVPIPRLNAWYGNNSYRYSGTTFPAKPLTPLLHGLKNDIERDFKIELNSVLANLYRSGKDCVGWHSDNEKMLGLYPQIASVSLGESRRFLIRNKSARANQLELELKDGSLLLMLGRCQKDWEHCIPKTTKLREPRVNLTFRQCQ